MNVDKAFENGMMILTAAGTLMATMQQEWVTALWAGAAFIAYANRKIMRKQRDMWRARAMDTLELAQDAATVAVKASER